MNDDTPVSDRQAANGATSGPVRELPDEPSLTGRQKAWLAVRVVLKRLRFIVILLAVGLFVGHWDLILNYWEKWTQPAHAARPALDAGHEFYCPMDPQVVRSTYEPNGDVPKCPICGMPLSIRQKGEAVELPAGVTGRVQLTPVRIQLAGVETVPVEYRPVIKQTETVGYVTYDESRLSQVVSRVSGYVEVLHVDKTYQTVRAGEPLAEIYSPELYSGVQELLLAARSTVDRDLVASARERLRLFGVNDDDIDAIIRDGKAQPRLVLRSPRGGLVIDKNIVAGSNVTAGMTLLEIADLTVVWIEAEVYEKDIAFLRVGQPVEAVVEALPNRTFTGRVALVYPRVEAATRTTRVRFELANPDLDLRPGMFATVRIDTPLDSIEPFKRLAAARSQVSFVGTGRGDAAAGHEFLVVPEQAVIDTGSKKVVYVEREAGVFEGREVELGPRQDDLYPVLAGLSPGDRVAAAGSFLIDAETRLNPAAAAGYFGASGGPQSTASAAAAPAARSGTATSAARSGAAADPASSPAAAAPPEPSADDLKNVGKLPEPDRTLALAQRICPVTGQPLGSMGVPFKTMLGQQPVFLCCKGCLGKAKRRADEILKTLATPAATAPAETAPAGTAPAKAAPAEAQPATTAQP